MRSQTTYWSYVISQYRGGGFTIHYLDPLGYIHPSTIHITRNNKLKKNRAYILHFIDPTEPTINYLILLVFFILLILN